MFSPRLRSKDVGADLLATPSKPTLLAPDLLKSWTYVALVKYKKRSSQAMAKKKCSRGANVSAAIREYLDANPNAGPTEAAEAVSKTVGNKVSSIYVSNIKAMSKDKPAKRGRRGRKPGRPAATVRAGKNGAVGLNTIETVTKLVKDIGVATAKRPIDMLDWRK
jgi:hypothetical protein